MAKQKSSSRVEPQKLRSALLGGCFLLSMILLVVYTSYVVSFSNLSFWRSNRAAAPVPKAEPKIASTHQADAIYQKEKLPSNPFCDFSNRRNDYCEMEGDIRIHGNSSSIFFVASSNVNATKLQESWKLKPHPRKGDARAMARVTYDQVVRCYPHVIVGLKFHKEMSIDPSKSPYGLTMVDFGRFIRKSFALERDMAIKLGPDQGKKPRILIIARKWTRRFANVDEIVRNVEEMGFEAVVAEAKLNLIEFAHIVNSCDVMLGVHGAGLTNLVFLPTNAVVIQVVPLGGLEGISWIDFGLATISMKMHYMQYTISLDESTLTEQFARGDPVLSDQKEAYKKHGWDRMIDLYFAKQGVKLDMGRFSSTLLHALELLRQE
ncbi:hypothetical protein C4D60_Mb04t31620 [Musa balbisiana]|uniref:Glycosyltransferase 61 catalytic domain-containing protein n=1 Tax=Musa balbisiana TaxID=52838 RepID=A0A4S8KG79_MUSBA|nr:hypothetical protein C4D60_Mb04t31620 [Musa balbisiana]